MGTNTGSNIHKTLRVGSTVIARAFLGTQKVFDRLDYPTLDLNFALTKSLDPRITFTRASSGTYFDSNGVIQTATTNTPRFDHNRVTRESLGLLIEEQRTNLLLNSTTLSTQSVTVTPVAHSLSFYGTGTVTLSGVHSATVNGTGVFPSRKILTFTPTAGTLTLTVSGTVQYAQLEAGNFATSWIPTTGATATRAADNPTISGSNFSSWYNQSQGTFTVEAMLGGDPIRRTVFQVDDGSSNNLMALKWAIDAEAQLNIVSGGTSQVNIVSAGYSSLNVIYKRSFAYAVNNFEHAINGVSVGIDTSGILPSPTTLRLRNQNSEILCGWVRRVTFYPTRLSSSDLITLSSY